jgi:hypothetical protein
MTFLRQRGYLLLTIKLQLQATLRIFFGAQFIIPTVQIYDSSLYKFADKSRVFFSQCVKLANTYNIYTQERLLPGDVFKRVFNARCLLAQFGGALAHPLLYGGWNSNWVRFARGGGDYRSPRVRWRVCAPRGNEHRRAAETSIKTHSRPDGPVCVCI